MPEIVFNEFPATFNVPGVYAEYDGSRAMKGVQTVPQKVLAIGQKLAAGVAAAGVPVVTTSADDAGRLAGRGSMLHQMALVHFLATAQVPLVLLPLADAGGSTASVRTLTCTGPSTEAGTVALYIGGRRYGVNLVSGTTAAQAATAIAAAIQADDLRFVTAAVPGGAPTTVTLTARNAGIDAGNISCVTNRYSTERLPAGLTLAVSALTAGTGNPDITATVNAIADQWYPTFAMGYGDTTNLTYLGTELTSRNGPIRQIEGVAFVGVDDSVANELTFAAARNHPFIAPIDAHDTLMPSYVTAASAAAVSADSAQNDPAMPEQTLSLLGLVAIGEAAGRRTVAERQQLIAGGVGTVFTDSAGTMHAERFTTSYRTNPTTNTLDKTRFDVVHERIWAQTRYSIRQLFGTRYARYKLGVDGSLGPAVMTPSLAKSECIALYKDFMDRGWYEGGAAFEQFKSDLAAAINAGDPNRLDILFPPDFMNQLRVTAVLVQPRG